MKNRRQFEWFCFFGEQQSFCQRLTGAPWIHNQWIMDETEINGVKTDCLRL